MSDKYKQVLTGIGVAVFWVAVWEAASLLVGQELLLPSPVQVTVTWAQLLPTGGFWLSVLLSLARVAAGFAAAVLTGSILAVLTTRFSPVSRLLSPILHTVRATPVASFIILAYVWLRVQILPAFIAFLMVVPLVWENVSRGIAETDRKLLETARVFRLSRGDTVRRVWWPSVRPYWEAACAAGWGFAWKSGIAAEVICCPELSIGRELHDAKAYLHTPAVFAWTATVILMSVVCEKLLRRFSAKQGVKA